ncbi:hypothetical protein XENTR_v10017234 [Xenopus tropicalis]|nr:hypothetical protein XENTR_v10017234 [Xenopus tropicalis]
MLLSYFLTFTLFLVFSIAKAFPILTITTESETPAYEMITKPSKFAVQASFIAEIFPWKIIIPIACGIQIIIGLLFYCAWKIIKKQRKEKDLEKNENDLLESPREQQTVISMPGALDVTEIVATEIKTEVVKAEEEKTHVDKEENNPVIVEIPQLIEKKGERKEIDHSSFSNKKANERENLKKKKKAKRKRNRKNGTEWH